MTKDTNIASEPSIKRYKIGYHTDEWGVRSSTPGGITDPSGQWVLYKDHLAALASHGQAPARADMQDAYMGAREDLAIWKRRALEAERDLRAERETASRLAAEINAINGPTHLGEPAPTAQPAPAATSQADSAPLAAPDDTVVLEAALRAIHQAIDLIGEPDTERLRTVRRVLRGAVVVAEDSTAPQADSQPARDERDDFEKTFPRPSGCIRCGTGYASTDYSNWAAHTHVERWEGWRARAARAPADSVLEDAARYRYLTRSMGDYCVTYADENGGDVLKAAAADAAIDAARAAQEGKAA